MSDETVYELREKARSAMDAAEACAESGSRKVAIHGRTNRRNTTGSLRGRPAYAEC
jgi:hypothetical protein